MQSDLQIDHCQDQEQLHFHDCEEYLLHHLRKEALPIVVTSRANRVYQEQRDQQICDEQEDYEARRLL